MYPSAPHKIEPIEVGCLPRCTTGEAFTSYWMDSLAGYIGGLRGRKEATASTVRREVTPGTGPCVSEEGWESGVRGGGWRLRRSELVATHRSHAQPAATAGAPRESHRRVPWAAAACEAPPPLREARATAASRVCGRGQVECGVREPLCTFRSLCPGGKAQGGMAFALPLWGVLLSRNPTPCPAEPIGAKEADKIPPFSGVSRCN